MKLKKQQGASAVEFALIMPVLLVILFGIVEFGLALYDKAVITNASREGARAGIVFKDPPFSNGEITTVINNYCQDRLVTFGSATNVTTTIAREGASVSGDDLTVTVAYKYDYLVLPGFISALTGGLNLSATTVMRME
jgi:Flp pilus assembly protein TadG